MDGNTVLPLPYWRLECGPRGRPIATDRCTEGTAVQAERGRSAHQREPRLRHRATGGPGLRPALTRARYGVITLLDESGGRGNPSDRQRVRTPPPDEARTPREDRCAKDHRDPSHISKMVPPTIHSGPPTETRTPREDHDAWGHRPPGHSSKTVLSTVEKGPPKWTRTIYWLTGKQTAAERSSSE